MNKYKINYKEKTRFYWGEDTYEAIEKFERQNKVEVKVNMIDADTRGRCWAFGYILDNDGIPTKEFLIERM